MKESKLSSAITRYVKSRNGMVLHNVAGDYRPAGWPDLSIVHTYWSGFIEVKGPKTKLAALQERMLRDIDTRWPGHAVVVRGVEGDMKHVIVSWPNERHPDWKVALVDLIPLLQTVANDI